MTDAEMLLKGTEQLTALLRSHNNSKAVHRNGTEVGFYRLDSKERLAGHPLLDQMNQYLLANGVTIRDWTGPQVTAKLRLEIPDETGWVRQWCHDVSRNKTELNLFTVEVLVQHPRYGYMLSADMFTVSKVWYDTGLRDVLHRHWTSDRVCGVVVDFDIYHTMRIDDDGYIKEVVNRNPSFPSLDMATPSNQGYGLLSDFFALSETAGFPINHLYQAIEALGRKDVKQLILETVKQHKGI